MRRRPTFDADVMYGDIVRGLPLSAHGARLLYCSHVLEHLALNECRLALRNSLAALGQGGCFRLVVPDLRVMSDRYVSSATSEGAPLFMRSLGMGLSERQPGALHRVLDAFGNWKHLWMWDFDSLFHELEAAGFVRIRRASFGDSQHPEFAAVEAQSRWVDAVGIECERDAASQP